MAIGDDFSVAANGDIRHVSGTTTYEVIDFHRWLQDLADDSQASGNDIMDITVQTPSARATDQIVTLISPYNVDDAAVEYLYNGSIEQSGGDTLYSGLQVVGSLAGTTTLQIVQNGTLYDGAAPFWGTNLNADAAANILIQCLVKTRDVGADIDAKKIRVFAREWGHTFSEFEVTMGLGVSVAAIFTNTDLNNQTSSVTVGGWTTITNVTAGYNGIDVDGNSTDEYYYSEWNRAAYSINQFYERMKYLTQRGETTTLYGLAGELFRGITHQVALNTAGANSGTFSAFEAVSWTGGTGQMLAIEDTTAATADTMWIQLLTGSAPGDAALITGGTSAATATTATSSAVTTRTLSPVFIGQSTGSAIIGAYGVGIESADLTVADLLFDLTNTQRQPPNNVTFTVYGLVSGEDRLLVTNDQTSGIDFDQMALTVALTSGTETAVVVGTGNIPADTPQTGTLRIELASGIYKRVDYTSHNSDDTFTIGSTSFVGDTAAIANNVFLAYIDKLAAATSEAFTVVYSADRTLYIRVRDGGASPIKTFETTGSLTTAGGSSTAIRTSDA